MLPGRRTADGALFVTQGPPPAGTPLVGGIAVRADGTIYVSQAFTFSPLDLFANNEQGAWYDPSDLSTMFQDSTGTTPVTAVGQPVGLILDKSGRGNHASQATAAARPLLQNDGVNNYLAFDGVDDFLATAACVTHSLNMTNSIGMTNNVPGSWPRGAFSVRDANSSGQGFLLALVSSSQNNELVVSSYSTTALSPPYAFVQGTTKVVTAIKEQAIAKRTLRVNGVQQSTDSTAFITTPASPSLVPINIGLNYDSQNSAINVYSLIIRGTLSTTQEITDTETWVNSKTGAY